MLAIVKTLTILPENIAVMKYRFVYLISSLTLKENNNLNSDILPE